MPDAPASPAPLPAWFRGVPRDMPGPGRFFYTTNRYPLFYLQITKCGCTFLKNLMYYLDHGRLHENSARIHAHEADLLKADLIPRPVLKESPYLFAVVRDPVDRFLSLYFDKIANHDNQWDVGMRRRVIRAAGLDGRRNLPIEAHRENCVKMLDWIKRNLDDGTEGNTNPHWQRQTVRLSRLKGLDARLLTLEGLSWQLPRLLAPLVPDIAAQMDAVRARNRSPRLFTRQEFVTPEIEAAVKRVYARDAEIHARARAEWGPGPEAGQKG